MSVSQPLSMCLSLCCCLVAWSCPTLRGSVDCGPPGFSGNPCMCSVTSVVSDSLQPHGLAHQVFLSTQVLWTGILEWVAMPSSRGSSQHRDRTQVSLIAGRFFAVWATREDQKSMGFHRQEYWSGLPFPSRRDLPSPGIEPTCLASAALQTEPLPIDPPGKLAFTLCMSFNCRRA